MHPKSFFDLILHLDVYLPQAAATYEGWLYLILAAIIFCETGLVVTPFLPGDSLLFVTGAVAAQRSLQVVAVFFILWAAGTAGDSTNYWIGRLAGEKAFGRFLNRKYLERTHQFYEKYGANTIVLARFVPIVRTFAPFVAGVGQMRYRRFVTYSVLGNCLWIGIFTFGGYFFGNIPLVKQHFSLVIVAIILISVMPGLVEYLRHKLAKQKA
ncbi:MAG: DedA family protein [candidate division WS1 bacterium]|nr:DedA family protein [candidate division WS1 bacterium]